MPALNNSTEEVIEALATPVSTANSRADEVLFYSSKALEMLFEAGVQELRVSLTLENAFGGVGNRSATVALSSDSRPTLHIVGGTGDRTVYRPDTLSVMADATATVCDDGDSNESRPLDYEWSLAYYRNGGGGGGENATGLESTSPDPRFFALGSSDKVRLICGRSDLEAIISGGNRLSKDPDVQGLTGAAAGLAFAWNCTNLDDPRDTSCENAVGGSNLTSEEIALDLSLLGYRVFEFSVRVTKRYESSSQIGAAAAAAAFVDSASIELYHDVDPPMVSINESSSGGVVLKHERHVVSGSVFAYLPAVKKTAVWLNTTWSVVQGFFVGEVGLQDVSRSALVVNRRESGSASKSCRGDSTSWYKAGDASSTCDWVAESASRCEVVGQDGSLARDACSYSCTSGCLFVESQVNLVIERDNMIEGATYTLELRSVITGANNSGFATVEFYVERSPRGGDVEVTPARGRALNTSFTISALNWEGDELPLLYGFSTDGGQVLRVSTEDAVLSDVLLPAGDDENKNDEECDECVLTVVATIQDAIGASTEYSVEVIVEPNTASGNALLARVDDLLSTALVAHSYEDVCNVVSPPSGHILLFNVSALSLDTVFLVLDEINGIIGDATEIDYGGYDAQNSLDVLSRLLESNVFDEDETRRRRRRLSTTTTTTKTTTLKNESEQGAAVATMYDSIDTFARKLVAPLVDDEEYVGISTSNVEVVVRRSSGSDAVALETGGAAARLPEQSEAYTATITELRATTTTLRDDGSAALTSNSVVRFSATAESRANATTALFLLPKARNATSAPTSAPLRSNVTLECPWNSRETFEARCPVDNSTIRWTCNGTKYVQVFECGIDVEDNCVSWGSKDSNWTTDGCRVNSAAASASVVACECEVEFASFSNNDTARDFGTRNVFVTYARLFTRSTFGGSVDTKRASVMTLMLGSFVVVVAALMYLGHLQDVRDARAAAESRGGAPPVPDAPCGGDDEEYSVSWESEEFRNNNIVPTRSIAFDGGAPDFIKNDDDDEDSIPSKIRLNFRSEIQESDYEPFCEDPTTDTKVDLAAFPLGTESTGSSWAGTSLAGGTTDVCAMEDPSRTNSVGTEDESLVVESRRRFSRSGASFRVLVRSRSTLTSRFLDEKNGIANWKARFKDALLENHACLSIWATYSTAEPRAARILAFAFEILLVAACFAFEKQYEYPDPGSCTYRAPPSDGYRRIEHFWVVLITTVVLIPIMLVFEKSFEVVCATGVFRVKRENDTGGAPPNSEADFHHSGGSTHSLITQQTEEDGSPPRLDTATRSSFASSSSLGRTMRRQNSSYDVEEEDAGKSRRSSFAGSVSSRRTSHKGTHEGLKIHHSLPPERQSRKLIKIKPRVYCKVVLFENKALMEEARERTPAVCEAVNARREEIRNDIKAAVAEGTVVGGRKARILHKIEQEFVDKWGWSKSPARLQKNVFQIVLHELRLARKWYDMIESIEDEDVLAARLAEFAQVSQLSWAERKVYKRSVGMGDDDDDATGDGKKKGPSRPALVASALNLAVVFVLPLYYLIIYASNTGVKETWHWFFATLFLLALIYCLVNPTVIFILFVVMPGLIQEKLAHNPKLNRAKYIFATQLPEDAFDFLLDLRPDVKPLVSNLVSDKLAQELRSMRKEELTPEALEEIHVDMRWQTLVTISAGLFVSALFLRLPEILQDAIFGEVIMLAPLATFYIISLFNAHNESAWNSGLLCLATLACSGVFIFVVTRLVTFTHRRVLLMRERHLKKQKERTGKFIERTSEVLFAHSFHHQHSGSTDAS
ncbi:hypothetical protein CTAYLR_000713 [Chrysophaeum taylorii]|uniref:PKD/REJ-like domain-containing protein n=1 Tax=Chrysophaeum taylorii TaxID=2483200 RepID=A0AAD7XJC3_9STRA|nr:hypothetical protein CTAYLR_000713 [Chrysophaeum taylorii]